MKFSTIRDLKLKTNKVLKALLTEGIIFVTRYGKPIAILEKFTEDDFAEQFDRLRAKTVSAAKEKGIKSKDIDRIIQEVRRSA